MPQDFLSGFLQKGFIECSFWYIPKNPSGAVSKISPRLLCKTPAGVLFCVCMYSRSSFWNFDVDYFQKIFLNSLLNFFRISECNSCKSFFMETFRSIFWESSGICFWKFNRNCNRDSRSSFCKKSAGNLENLSEGLGVLLDRNQGDISGKPPKVPSENPLGISCGNFSEVSCMNVAKEICTSKSWVPD